MFAQLANTILHGVRIFDEAAKNTTPAEMNRPDDCNEARSLSLIHISKPTRP